MNVMTPIRPGTAAQMALLMPIRRFTGWPHKMLQDATIPLEPLGLFGGSNVGIRGIYQP